MFPSIQIVDTRESAILTLGSPGATESPPSGRRKRSPEDHEVAQRGGHPEANWLNSLEAARAFGVDLDDDNEHED